MFESSASLLTYSMSNKKARRAQKNELFFAKSKCVNCSSESITKRLFFAFKHQNQKQEKATIN